MAFDSFDYTPGALSSNNGGSGDWTGAWSAVSETTVVTKSMSYSSGDISISGGSTAVRYLGGDSQSLAARAFTPQLLASGPVYMSFLFETSTGGSGAEDFFAIFPQRSGLTDANADDYGVNVRREAAGVTRFGVRADDGGSQVFGGPSIFNNVTHLVVMKIDYNSPNNELTMFIDPVSLVELDEISAMDTGGNEFSTNVSELKFRAALGGGTYFIDEMRVGTTFASVVTVPEPGSGWLMLLGLMAVGPLVWRQIRLAG